MAIGSFFNFVHAGVEGVFAVHDGERTVLYGLGQRHGVHRSGDNRAAFGHGRSSFGVTLDRSITTVAAQRSVGEVVEYCLGVGMGRACSLVVERAGRAACDFVEVVLGGQTRNALRIVVVGLGNFVGRESSVIELHRRRDPRNRCRLHRRYKGHR